MRKPEPSSSPRAPRVPLLPLLVLAGTTLTLATPRDGSGVELVSITPSGQSGTTNAGAPDSTGAAFGRVMTSQYMVAFQSKAKDLMSGGLDVNGMSDVYLYDYQQHKVVELLSVATNGKSGCAGTVGCSDGGSYAPALGYLSSVVAFESDAQNLTPGYLPAFANAQTQIYARNVATDVTTLVTASAQNAAKGANGDASELVADLNGRFFAFTFAGDVKQLKGLSGLTDGNSSGSDIIVWDQQTNGLLAASVRQAAQTQTGNGSSSHPRMSTAAKCVVFESTSNNLDGSISGSHTQIYARFFATGKTVLISKVPGGTEGGNLDSTNARPNGDCSAIVFQSQATNLVGPGVTDSNGSSDVFLWTNQGTPQLTLVSRAMNGTSTGNGGSSKPSIGATSDLTPGVAVAFESDAGDLVAGDSPGTDVFHWQSTGATPPVGTTTLLSGRFSGQGSAGGHDPLMPFHGVYVLFSSDSDQLIQGVDPDHQQLWLRGVGVLDRPITLVSGAADGTPANAPCDTPTFTQDGVLFQTTASNLAASGVDTNGAIDVYAARIASVTVTVGAPTVMEGASFDVTATQTNSDLSSIVTVTLSAKAPAAGPAATDGVDMTLGTITLLPGEATKTISVPTLQDYLVEGDEGFQLHATITKGLAFKISPDVSILIEDDDHDADSDGVNDETDNCVTTQNPDQLDTDGDGLGNVCDTTEGSCNNAVDDDTDGISDCHDPECASDATCGKSAEEDPESDGVPNINDNCVAIANADQLDTDADGIGNACDTSEGACGNFLDDDADGDVDCDDVDCASDIVCAAPASDDDGDGVPNALDLCPLAPNPLQADTDSDGIGDACDNDEGLCNDGVDNDADAKVDCDDENCVKDAVCQKPDEDTDGDGLPNKVDDCPFVANPDQSDSDGDGAGDVCDSKEDACANMLDDDADAKVDCADENCASTPVCADPTGDVDGDSAANNADNCPNVANPDQADADADGVGDACDKSPEGPPVPMGEGGAGGGGGAGPQPEPEDAGCSCAVVNDDSSGLSWIAAIAGVALFASRRRRRA